MKDLLILVIYPDSYEDFRAYKADFMINYSALNAYKLRFVKVSELESVSSKYDAIIGDNRIPGAIIEEVRLKLGLFKSQISFLNIGEKQVNKTTFTGAVKEIKRRKND